MKHAQQAYQTHKAASKSFNKAKSADLLYSAKYKVWVVDTLKSAKQEWPKLYEIIQTK